MPFATEVPRWSATRQDHLVAAVRFLVFRFRLDSWWFGVPLLIRGPLINLPVVLATDFPPIQVVCIAMILTTMMVLRLIFISHLSLVWGSCWSCILLPTASRAFLFPSPEKAYTCQTCLYQTYHTHNNLNQTCLHQIYLMFMTHTTLVVVVVVVVVVVIRS